MDLIHQATFSFLFSFQRISLGARLVREPQAAVQCVLDLVSRSTTAACTRGAGCATARASCARASTGPGARTTTGPCAAATCGPASACAASAIGARSSSAAGVSAIPRRTVACVAGCAAPHGPIWIGVALVSLVSAITRGRLLVSHLALATVPHLALAAVPHLALATVSHLTLATVPGRSAVLRSIALRAAGSSGSLLCLSATGGSSTRCPGLAHRRDSGHRTRCCKYYERSFDRQVCFLLIVLHNKLT